MPARQFSALAPNGCDHGDHRGANPGLLIDADGAGIKIDARQVQGGHQHQIAIVRERISLEKNPRAGNDLIGIGRQGTLIEARRHCQRLGIPQQNIEQAERLDMPSGHQQAQSQRSLHDQADRAPQPFFF